MGGRLGRLKLDCVHGSPACARCLYRRWIRREERRRYLERHPRPSQRFVASDFPDRLLVHLPDGRVGYVRLPW